MCLCTICAILIINLVLCDGSDIYHLHTKTKFVPDTAATYFGYSVVLTKTRLFVGAPKANYSIKNISPGKVFTCRLNGLYPNTTQCSTLDMDNSDTNFLKDNMWFGATIATVPDGKLVACAPRWADTYISNKGRTKHLLAYGACYSEKRRLRKWLTPLDITSHLAYKADGSRQEYGPYGMNVMNYYAYGQAGMSIKVTDKDVIIGAPGLLQWTGGIIDYRYNTVTMDALPQPINNPYKTLHLGPDDYFGYSVEAGVFKDNGSTLYVAGAPRSADNHGQVLIFDPPSNENVPLSIRDLLKGPHLGSYFGASLCCTDINGDGKADLLVGAPNYVTKQEDMPYDQGAVFIYLTKKMKNGLMRDAGHVTGSAASGARFGSAIAALGDIDSDSYNDIAIGAPYENDGVGAVYIYRGSEDGLQKHYLQRIVAEGAKGFGFSISKGVDIDSNNCNDVAIGAYESSTAYMYHCIPTIRIETVIKVPGSMNLPKNVTVFSVSFCVYVLQNTGWPSAKSALNGTIIIDPNHNRTLSEQVVEFKMAVAPGTLTCKELTVEIEPTANFIAPFQLTMDLVPSEMNISDSEILHKKTARISADSSLHKTTFLQLMQDCGIDLICTPKLVLTMEPIESFYIPGGSKRLGVTITVLNEEEPADDVQVLLRLPLPPKRVPINCALEGLNMTCDVQNPLERNKSESWDVELEYNLHGVDKEILNFVAELKHPRYLRHLNLKVVKVVNVAVVPTASFNITGKSLPNNTITIIREKFYETRNVSFTHYFEVKNLGPSDWLSLRAELGLPKNVTVTKPIKGCSNTKERFICEWSVPANTSIPLEVALNYNLSENGIYLAEKLSFNATTSVTLLTEKQESLSITTSINLEPTIPIWPLILAIVVSSIIGLSLLAGIVYGLHKYGFFSRTSHEELKRRKEQEEDSTEMEAGCSTSPPSEADESTLGLISEDSD